MRPTVFLILYTGAEHWRVRCIRCTLQLFKGEQWGTYSLTVGRRRCSSYDNIVRFSRSTCAGITSNKLASQHNSDQQYARLPEDPIKGQTIFCVERVHPVQRQWQCSQCETRSKNVTKIEQIPCGASLPKCVPSSYSSMAGTTTTLVKESLT